MKAGTTLKENYEFRRLYQKGKTAVGGCMVLYCRRNNRGRNRLGITVSTKVGNAVKRNLRQAWDIVLVARGRTLTASWKEMNDTFLRLARKTGLALEEPR